MDENVSSCGRWCGVRILLRTLTLDEFIKLFKPYKKINLDWLITAFTLKI